MGFFRRIQYKLVGLIHTTNRYPLAMILLLATAAVNAYMIHPDTQTQLQYPFTLAVGAALAIIAQQVYERFSLQVSNRLLLKGGAVILMLVYYFMIANAANFDIEGTTKTSVLMFALAIMFMWVPSIKNRITFNETFMAGFKAFFTTVLFTGVIALGVSAVLFAVDQLLFSINIRVYQHIWNIIFVLFAPVFFLSLIPVYPGKKKDETNSQTPDIQAAITCPKTLSVLLSYVIIPLTGIYTIVLLAYVLINIPGDFWKSDLLESMLVSYAIITILVYILASSLTNQFAAIFRSLLPVVLIPIVFFQTVASILKIGDMAITPGRYYVIMFGVFAIISGLIFIFFSIRKNGWIAIILFVFSIVSIIPPVDAFTVSQANQAAHLQETLRQNNMLENGEIHPDASIPFKDKQTITQTVSYLERMDHTDELDWLPNNVFYQQAFKKTFGFDKEEEGNRNNASAYLDWDQNPEVDIADYDRMVHINIDQSRISNTTSMEVDGSDYRLKPENDDGRIYLTLESDDQTILQFDITKAFGKILEAGEQGTSLSTEDATITEFNENAQMTIIADSINYYDSQYSGEVYVFVNIK